MTCHWLFRFLFTSALEKYRQPSRFSPAIAATNAQLQRFADGQERVTYVDCNAVLLREVLFFIFVIGLRGLAMAVHAKAASSVRIGMSFSSSTHKSSGHTTEIRLKLNTCSLCLWVTSTQRQPAAPCFNSVRRHFTVKLLPLLILVQPP